MPKSQQEGFRPKPMTLSSQADGLCMAGLLLLLVRLGERKLPTGSAGTRVSKLNSANSSSGQENILIRKTSLEHQLLRGAGLKVLLAQSRPELQMKGEFGRVGEV